MVTQRYGREVREHEEARQCPGDTHTDAERSRESKEGKECLRYLIEARELCAGLEAQSPLDEARGSICGQCHGGKGDSETNGVAENASYQSASHRGSDETAPCLVISEQTAPIPQCDPRVDGCGEAASEQISRGPGCQVRGDQEHEGLERVWQQRCERSHPSSTSLKRRSGCGDSGREDQYVGRRVVRDAETYTSNRAAVNVRRLRLALADHGQMRLDAPDRVQYRADRLAR